MLLFLQHKAQKPPPSASLPNTLLPVPPGGVRFWHLLEPLAGSDVIPAKSLSVTLWSTEVTCSGLFLPIGGSTLNWESLAV